MTFSASLSALDFRQALAHPKVSKFISVLHDWNVRPDPSTVAGDNIELALDRRRAVALAQLNDRYESCRSALEAHAISEVRFAQSLGALHAEESTEQSAELARATAKKAFRMAGEDIEHGVKMIRRLSRKLKRLLREAREARDNNNRDALRGMIIHSLSLSLPLALAF